MSVIPFHRADDPDLDDVIGGEGPPPNGESDPDGEHTEHLRRAYGHMAKCARRIERALALLDEGPLTGGADDIDPVQFDPAVDDNPQGDSRRALVRRYARMVGV